MEPLIEYMKDHVALIAVLGVVLLLIVTLVVLLAVEIARSRKRKAAPAPEEEMPAEEPPRFGEEAPAPEPAPAEEEVREEPAPAEETSEPAPEPEPASEPEPAPEEPKKTAKNDMAGYVFVPVKKEKKTAAETTDEREETMKQDEPAKKAVPAKPVKKESVGKWIVYEEDRGGYGFRLVASNGEVMIKSSSPYASLSSAKSGIKTYQDNIAAGRLEVVETKSGSFFVQVNNANKRLLATSADYKTRTSCENALDSIKRWAATHIIVVETPEEDAKK